MKQQFAGLFAILFTLVVFPYAYANLGQVDESPAKAAPAYSIHLKKAPHKSPGLINVRYRNEPLSSVLKNISDETGIVFQVSDELLKKDVNIDISSKTWRNVVSKLLEKYSRVEVWTENNDSSRIWLLKNGELKYKEKKRNKPSGKSRTANRRAPSQAPQPGPVPIPTPTPAADITNGNIQSLPAHILMDPSVIAFFEKAGLTIPDYVRNMAPKMPAGAKIGKIPSYILNDPVFTGFLGAKGIPLPVG